jgi:hypothetical protein
MVGVDVNDNAYTNQLWLAGDTHNRVQADGVVMSGNFATGDHYLVSEIVGGPPSRSSRRGSRSGAASGPRSIRSASQDAFRPGRWVYLVSETGRRVAREITAVNGASATITVTEAISVGCFGYGRGARISPISRVEYYADRARERRRVRVAPAGRHATERYARGVEQTILARRELSFSDANTPIANSERVVLEYLVHFDAAITRATAAAGVVDPGLVETLDGDGGAAALAADPGSGRAVRVTLVCARRVWIGTSLDGPTGESARALAQLPSARAAQHHGHPGVGQAPAAHVRTAEEVIMLENIANRGL